MPQRIRKYECEACTKDFPEHLLLQLHRIEVHHKQWVEKRSLPGGGLPPRIAAPRIPPPRVPALREQPGGPGTAPTMLGSPSPLSVSSGAGTGPAPPGLMGGPSFLGRGEQMHPLPPMIRNDSSAQFTGSSRSIALPGNFTYMLLLVAAAHESSLNLPEPGLSSRLYQKLVEHWESRGIDPLTMSPSGPMSQRSNSNTVTSITSNNRVGATTASLPAGRTLSQENQNLHDAAARSSLDQLTEEMGLRNQQGSVDVSGQQHRESRGTGPGPSLSSDK